MANAIIAAGQPTAIKPDEMYPLSEAMRRMGWREHSFRQARKNGLAVMRVGRTAYVMGSDLIAHVQANGGD